MQRRFSVVVSGSFRKHFEGIQKTILDFHELGIAVRSPKPSKVVNPGEEFALLESDDTSDPDTLQRRHLEAITESDALYLYDPEGYVGASATLELGWALAHGKPVYALEPAKDFTLGLFCKEATPTQVRAELAGSSLLDGIGQGASLDVLQAYMRRVVEVRGFEDETAPDLLLLMCEEVGELAKALRKQGGLKVDAAKADAIAPVSEEIADVFIYLLCMANTSGVRLFDAFRRKEEANSARTWVKKH